MIRFFDLPRRYCSVLDDLRQVRKNLRDLKHCNGVLYNENRRLEEDLAVLHAGNVELQRLVDKLVEERDEAQGAVLGAELELMRRGIG